MTATLHRRVLVALVMTFVGATTVVAPPAIVPAAASSDASDSTGSGSTKTTTTLTADFPHGSTSHDAGSGGWTFVVEGNKHVISVRISVAENDCATGGETLWDTKVTDDELESGAVAREVAFVDGLYCSHLLLDGNKNGTATVTTDVPVRPEADPDAESCVSPTVTSSPTPEASPSESATADASESPEPDTSASPSPTPCGDAPEAETSTEYDRCPDDSTRDPGAPKVDHRVLAGATGPDPDKPFIYQKFYPSTLQVHKGDLVEWCFNGGYDWHTVTFLPADMDVAAHPEATEERAATWRWDETGQKAFGESWLFGPDAGDEKKQCGRGKYFHVARQTQCSLSGTDQWVSSSLWDRFFSMARPGTFEATIDLEPGLYRYHCNIHSSMEGFIEVLPATEPLGNPTATQIDDEIAVDHAEAQQVFETLSDPSDAYDYDPATKEWVWTVNVGAETDDRSVAIEQFLPARIDVREGDTVRYVAGSDEPNTVTFPGGRQLEGGPLTVTHPDGQKFDLKAFSDPQGGFSAGGRCGPHSCPSGLGAPWGMTGLAFVWDCDDDRASGAPGTLPYVPAATAFRANGRIPHGCVAGGLPELITQPWYGRQQAAPLDLVLTEKTFHNSGTLLDETLPDWYRTTPSNGVFPEEKFPSEFDATFKTTGTFNYFCAAHEFMNGVVNVIERTR